MSPSRSTLRRLVAASAAVAAVVGVLATTGPATAAGQIAGGTLTVGPNADGACSGAGHEGYDFSLAKDGTATRTLGGSGAVTNPGDSSDTSAWTATGTATVTTSGGGTALEVRSKVDLTMDAAKGDASACHANIGVTTTGLSLLDVSTPGWVVVDADNLRGTTVFVYLFTLNSSQLLLHGTYGQAHYHASFWVDPGQYSVTLGFQSNADDDSTTPAPAALKGTASGTAYFVPAGGADGAASGSGAPMLSMGSGVNCTDHQLAVSFTSKAAGLASATFSVNGKKQVVRAPRPGQAVLLPSGSASRDTVVRATLTPRTGKARSVSRTYLACS